jgi:hypothetical protein
MVGLIAANVITGGTIAMPLLLVMASGVLASGANALSQAESRAGVRENTKDKALERMASELKKNQLKIG